MGVGSEVLQWGISLGVFFSSALVGYRCRDNAAAIATVAVVYSSLQFLYTLVALWTDSGWMEQNASFAAARVCGSVMVVMIMAALARIVLNNRASAGVAISIFCCAISLLVVAGCAPRIDLHTTSNLKDSASMMVMSILVLLFSLAFMTAEPSSAHLVARQAFPLIASMTFFSAGVALFEIASMSAWARYLDNFGRDVARASGIFFNPNWYGAWSSLSLIYFLFLESRTDQATQPQRYTAWLCAVVGVAIYLCGSRGSLVAAGLIMAIVFICGYNRARTFKLSLAFLSAFTGALVLPLAFSRSTAFRPFESLSTRWMAFPGELVVYAIKMVETHLPSIYQVLVKNVPDEYLAAENSPQFIVSVTGRFSGSIVDNAFSAAYEAGGKLALSGFILMFLGAAVLIGWAAIRRHGQGSVSILAALLAWLFVQSFLSRAFQVFPIWIFAALVMAAIYAVGWRMLLEGRDLNGQSSALAPR